MKIWCCPFCGWWSYSPVCSGTGQRAQYYDYESMRYKKADCCTALYYQIQVEKVKSILNVKDHPGLCVALKILRNSDNEAVKAGRNLTRLIEGVENRNPEVLALVRKLKEGNLI